MEKRKTAGHAETVLKTVMIWLISVLVLWLAGSALIWRTNLGEGSFQTVSFVALFLAAVISGISYINADRDFSLTSAILAGCIASVILLMGGFLAAWQNVHAAGVFRVAISSMGGFLAALLFRSKGKGRRKKSACRKKRRFG